MIFSLEEITLYPSFSSFDCFKTLFKRGILVKKWNENLSESDI